jgi:hypothetical protein
MVGKKAVKGGQKGRIQLIGSQLRIGHNLATLGAL